jgi:SAM-dependent methyltransferase
MIRRALRKESSVVWCLGEAEELPFRDDAFDGMTCVLSVHHFRDRGRVFKEAHRVLKSGRLVIFTASPAQMRGYWLNRYFPCAMEKSIEQMPTTAALEHELRSAGFRGITAETYSVDEGLKDLFLYSGKHSPEIYLDAKVRQGISTFASLASKQEIDSGCAKLAEDLEKGRFDGVIKDYRSECGDYLFLVAQE